VRRLAHELFVAGAADIEAARSLLEKNRERTP